MTLRAGDTLAEAARAAAEAAVEGPGQEVVKDLVRRRARLRGPRPAAADETTMRKVDPTPDRAGPPPGAAAEPCDFLTPPQGPDELGRLGPYRVLKVLGAGGMGVVFQAEDPRLKRLVALKAMRPGLANGATARERFLREAQATAAVEHDHIVHIYQVGEERGVPFLAMPLLKGETLHDRLKREGKLPLPEVLRIGRETAEGLAAAHERGLIHRDIKPGNLWLEGKRGRVKVLDFGLARAAGQEGLLTQPGVILGTPAYMAPEQAKGEAVDARADLFSLGCVLYCMATGELPFQGGDVMSVLRSLTQDTPKAPRQCNPEVPPALSDLILRLLAKGPAERPVSAAVVVKVLETIEKRKQAEAGTATLQLAPPVARPVPSPPAAPPPPVTPAAGSATLPTALLPGRPAPSPARFLPRGRLALAATNPLTPRPRLLARVGWLPAELSLRVPPESC
jgi:serine/threonine protein kinase